MHFKNSHMKEEIGRLHKYLTESNFSGWSVIQSKLETCAVVIEV
jgi:hypothetical protein